MVTLLLMVSRWSRRSSRAVYNSVWNGFTRARWRFDVFWRGVARRGTSSEILISAHPREGQPECGGVAAAGRPCDDWVGRRRPLIRVVWTDRDLAMCGISSRPLQLRLHRLLLYAQGSTVCALRCTSMCSHGWAHGWGGGTASME